MIMLSMGAVTPCCNLNIPPLAPVVSLREKDPVPHSITPKSDQPCQYHPYSCCAVPTAAAAAAASVAAAAAAAAGQSPMAQVQAPKRQGALPLQLLSVCWQASCINVHAEKAVQVEGNGIMFLSHQRFLATVQGLQQASSGFYRLLWTVF